MPDLPRNITRPVRRLYGRASLRLLRALADSARRTITAGVFGADRFRAEADLRDIVRAVYTELTRKAPEAGVEALERATRHGHRYALDRLPAGSVRPDAPDLDRLIRAELDRRMAEANTAVLIQVPQQAQRAAQATAAVDEDTQAATAQRHLDRAADQGVVRIPDQHGRHWGLTSYAVAATTSAANHQMLDTILGTYATAGVRLVRFTGVGSQHAACARWEGTVLALYGPPGPRIEDGVEVAGTVAEVRASGVWHPHCRHGLAPWTSGDYEPEPYPPHSSAPIPAQRLIERWRARQAVAITDRAREKARRRLAELRAALP